LPELAEARTAVNVFVVSGKGVKSQPAERQENQRKDQVAVVANGNGIPVLGGFNEFFPKKKQQPPGQEGGGIIGKEVFENLQAAVHSR